MTRVLCLLVALLLCRAQACLWDEQVPLSLRSQPTISRRQAESPKEALQWNKNNFFLGTRPFFPYAAEIHPWRLPVPGLWRDVLEKLKSQGYNAVSIYTQRVWALVMPSPAAASASLVSPANDLKQFLTIAKEVDMLVILRPGPYINAETTGGGFPGWIQNLEAPLRVNDTTFNDAWRPYMRAILAAARPFQLKLDSSGGIDASGGTLMAIQVENEFHDDAHSRPYFDEIIRFYREQGVTVPTTFNDVKTNGDFRDDKNLDLWGHDSYPMGFDCKNPTRFKPLVDYTPQSKFNTPNSILEFQGGSFAGWGGPSYDQCAQMTNSSFVRLFEKGALADGVKMKNNYMGFGGTNWGNLFFSDAVTTSYDYGAGLNEKRIKREKGGETSLLGSFLKSFPDFATTKVVKRGDNVDVTQQSASIFVSELGGNNSSFIIVRQSASSSSTTATFALNTGNGTIPMQGRMSITGRNSIIIPRNVALQASGAMLLYSTADVAFYGLHDSHDLLCVYGDAEFAYEVALQGSAPKSVKIAGGRADIDVETTGDVTFVRWTARERATHTVQITFGPKRVVLLRLSDAVFARKLQFPSLAAAGSLDALTGHGPRAVVQGAYHVASALIVNGTLALRGQLNNKTTLELFVPGNISSVTFEQHMPVSAPNRTAYGSFLASFDGPSQEAFAYQPPALTTWKVQDSRPELAADFQLDVNWKRADLNATPNAYYSHATTKEVLFASSYGFHSNGMVLWRGSFTIANVTSLPSFLSIETIGGSHFASSVYVNGNFVGTSSVQDKVNATGTYALGDTIAAGNNTVLVLIDSMGLEEHGEPQTVPGYKYPLDRLKQPRGINAFSFYDKSQAQVQVPITWYVTGNQGGEKLLDVVRGPLNEGGFYAERQGWHLPGFNDALWQEGSPMTVGAPAGGVRFFRTKVTLAVPHGHDLPMSIVFGGPSSDATQRWRALVFVNGWQFGKRIADVGRRQTFPSHQVYWIQMDPTRSDYSSGRSMDSSLHVSPLCNYKSKVHF